MVPPVSARTDRVCSRRHEPIGGRGTGSRGGCHHLARGHRALARRLVARLADPLPCEPGLPAARRGGLALSGHGALELRLAHPRASLDAELLGVVVELVARAAPGAAPRALASAPAGGDVLGRRPRAL